MERRTSSSKSPPKRQKKRQNARPKKTNIATTALGEEPEKRSRKKGAPQKGEAGNRELNVHVKTAKRREYGSTLWLKRQLNDPYVRKAKAEGYRSRAAYKLIELDEKFSVLRAGARIVDLGCAPGGWCQVAAKKVGGKGKVVGIDYLSMPEVMGADVLEMDFLDEAAPDKLKDMLGGEADVVLSDMAAPTTGHKSTDHLRIIALAEAALDFAEDVLAPGGAFVCKVFAGGAEGELLTRLKQNFETVKHAKPKASRSDSAEKYVVATGFRGRG
ncbi:RlmE family RNA methyltransferase [Hyphococcus flavus]|uniref:Ribosomal RNA large subunit methyltransferase E n=1 Tax=Hyphococcus flavus TaxID=1866326 RepID=A0AAE9ZDM8_9PROT|nr:RlmE family RNA methyltransferase [Hyphococcus flavus]WDI30723.1 RlmE family RNA methyltransferase [Hyphococcus flavus]